MRALTTKMAILPVTTWFLLAFSSPALPCEWNHAGDGVPDGMTTAPLSVPLPPARPNDAGMASLLPGSSGGGLTGRYEYGLLYPVEGLVDYNNQCTPSLTADGRTIVFTYSAVNGPGPIPNGIAMATWNDATGTWNPPVPTGLQGTRPFISPDGTRLYYAAPYQGNLDLWVSTWTGTGWSSGVRLLPPANSPSAETEPGLSLDGRRLYFSSNRPGGQGGFDLWVVRWNGAGWDSATNLGQAVNTPQHEGWPRETADRQTLYFGSWDRDLYGWGDLWRSPWTGGGWGTPVNMGSPVNTEMTACSPFVTWDMTRFYCGSEANEGSYGEEDIWVAELGPPASGGVARASGAVRAAPSRLAATRTPARATTGWVRTGELAGAEFVYCLIQASDQSLCAGTYPNGDVFRSTDAGDTWVNTAELPGADRVYALFQAADSTIYAGTYPNGDVFRTTDRGQTWLPTSDLPGATSVRCFAETWGAVYAGTAPGLGGPQGGGRVFRTTNEGTSWDPVGLVPDCEEAVLALMVTANGTLFAGGLHPQTIARSTNGGTSWTTAPIAYSGDVRSLLEDSAGVLWAGGWGHARKGRVYRSTNGGASWDTTTTVMVGEHNASRHYAIVEARPGLLFTGFQTGPDSVVYQSIDAGRTWTSTGALAGAREALCLLKTRDGTIYSGTSPDGDVFRYTFAATGVEPEEAPAAQPAVARLESHPNPFRPGGAITYELGRDGKLGLGVYSVSGRLVRLLADEKQARGRHGVVWDGRDGAGGRVPSGVYWLRVRFEDELQLARKIVLMP